MLLSMQQFFTYSLVTFITFLDCKSNKELITVYYCMPPEDGLRTETCSGSKDRGGEEELLH
jgi:hypothetical protein